MAKADEYQHVGPGEFEKIADNCRRLSLMQCLSHHLDSQLTGAEQFVAALGGLYGAPFAQFNFVLQGCGVLIELFK